MTHTLSPESLRSHFELALPYEAYVASGKPHEQQNWREFHTRVQITPAQRGLIAAINRQINVLCLSGTWCGDCVQQVPFLDHIQRVNPGKIALRCLDRDAMPEFSKAFKVCGGGRVPVALFLNEDFDFLSLLGDRTLSRYRVLAMKQLGGACPLPGAPVPSDEIAGQLQDWVNEFERTGLMLRLSNKLRQRHGD